MRHVFVSHASQAAKGNWYLFGTAPLSRHAKGPAIAEDLVLFALGLTQAPSRLYNRCGSSGICRVTLDFLATNTSLSDLLADSRSGQIKRARNYTT